MSFPEFLDELRSGYRPELGNLIVLAKAGSTNGLGRRVVRECCEEGSPIARAWVVAFEQTEGRGRLGHRWESPAGRGIYATLMQPLGEVEPASLVSLPLAVAAALCEALNETLDGAPCRLKWPNDLLVDERKVGGLLIETLDDGDDGRVALIGFGINHRGSGGELHPRAVTLSELGGRSRSLAEWAIELMRAAQAAVAQRGDAASVLEAYRRWLIHQPGDSLRVRVGEEVVDGTFLGLDDRGFLRLEVDGKERRMTAGEVESP